jgi:hypothetical protein
MVGDDRERHELDKAITRRVNERPRTAAMFGELGELAIIRSCPHCLHGEGLICRLDLLMRDEAPDGLGDGLSALASRLGALIGSMTTRRTEIGPAEAVSWIEALGWFGGWDYAPQARARAGVDRGSRMSVARSALHVGC